MNKRLKKVSGFMGLPEPVSQMNNLFATGALDPSWQMNLLSPGQDSMTGPEKLMAETAINNYPHDPVRRLFNRILEKKVKNNMKKHASIISYLNGVNKKASLDNNWIVKDPKTKTWDYTSLADEMNRHLVKLAWLWDQKQDTPKVATNPINPRTLGHLDKLVELGVITPAWRKDVLTKNDQDDAEGYAKWNIENALYGNPDVEKVYADWNDPSRPDDINKWKLTPYGQQLKDLHNDLFNKKTANLKKLAWYWTHQPVDNTTKGHLEQLVNLGLIDNKDKDNLLQKDNRDAMNFVRWCADNAVIGNPADDQIYKNYKNNPDYDYDIDKDELTPYGKKLKTFYDTVRKEASYKKI